MSFLILKRINRAVLAITLAMAASSSYACKMYPISYDSASLKSALEEISKSHKDGTIKSITRDKIWNIEILENKNCLRFEVETKMPGVRGCEINTKIISESEC